MGEPGPVGPAGPQGPSGAAGSGDGGAGGLVEGTLNVGCLSPCHGFTGIVEQWKTSTHFATYVANLGGEEVDSWTGTSACGNCHAIDGVEQRLAENVRYLGSTGPVHVAEGQVGYLNSAAANKPSESTYAGHATVAVVHCTTCHEVTDETDPHRTGAVYEPGSFPLRVPSGPTDEAYIEKSSAAGVSDGTAVGAYGAGNACIWCHKSRKDVTNYITASNTLSTRFGPHQGPHADVFSGKGGYHYPGKAYENSSHQALEKGCVSCHMGSVAANGGVGDHAFAPALSTCTSAGCHVGATSFDVIGGQTDMKGSLRELREALNDLDWLTRAEAAPFDALTPAQLADDNFKEDLPKSASGLTAAQAGAVYNYLLIARGGAGGIHNPLYVRQLIFDSYVELTGNPPPSMKTRPKL